MNEKEVKRSRDTVRVAMEYHERTKHHFGRYARSLGYMDWATQPNPFRRYAGSTRIELAHPPLLEEPTYDSLLGGQWPSPNPLTHDSLSQFFYEALAISAWKRIGSTEPWSLRINPSSGDLHPTEAYLIASPIVGISDEPAVYHYCAYEHALERRVILTTEEWTALATQLPAGAFLVALSSIYWRETWKYGERAFRYCHHDVGHAIGSVAFSAAVLGWQTRVASLVPDCDLNVLIGVAGQRGTEAEHGDCLMVVIPGRDGAWEACPAVRLSEALLGRLSSAQWAGEPNRLSVGHQPWPVIDQVSVACQYGGELTAQTASASHRTRPAMPDRVVPARAIIRRRRSAVDMDGVTGITRDTFYRILLDVVPRFAPFPFDVLPWQPRVALALFVNRVEGTTAGLYVLSRDSRHENELRRHCRDGLLWQRPADCPPGLALDLLIEGDARGAAKAVSCHQDIAADGAFSLGMLAQFESTLQECGAWMYPRLFWETGLIGQVLYLGAEAAGVRATGIGCFFDDPMHELLGITGHPWQSLYHFTVGTAVEDPRLTTLPPYWHLADQK